MLPPRMSGNDIPEGDEGTKLKVKGAESSGPIGAEVLRHVQGSYFPWCRVTCRWTNLALCRTARAIRIGKLVG